MDITAVTLFRADGTSQVLDHVPELEEAKKLVGGWVERVCPKHAPNVIFLCNEEGLIRQLPVNEVGCQLYGPYSPICGDIVVIPRKVKGARKWL